MGSSSKTTNSSQNQTATTTPTVAPWLSSADQTVASDATDLLGNSSQYTPESSSALQQTAENNASSLPSVGASSMTAAQQAAQGLTSQTAPTYSAATTSGAGNVTGAQTTGAQIQSLMSPYLNDVVNATANSEALTNAQQLAAQKAQAGLTGAFGSSGFGISNAELQGEQGLNDATVQSGLLNTGYNDAAQIAEANTANSQQANLADQGVQEQTALANQGATNTASANNQSAQLQSFAQQLSAALGLGTLGSEANATAANDAGVQGSLGQTQYGQDITKQQYPISNLAELASIIYGEPIGNYTSQTANESGQSSSTTNQNQSFLSDLLAISSLGANSGGSAGGSTGSSGSLGNRAVSALFNGG